MSKSEVHQILSSLIRLAAETPDSELECRIGTVRTDRFETGVTFEHFNQFVVACSKSPTGTWTNVQDMTECTDMVYPDNVRSRHVSSTLCTTVQKVALAYVDLRCSGRPLGIRVIVSQELPHDKPTSNAVSVRMKQTWLFQRGVWTYELSKTCSGKSQDDAMVQDPVYNMEIEVTNPSAITADGLLVKALDLVGRVTAKGAVDDVQPHVYRQWRRKRSRRVRT